MLNDFLKLLAGERPDGTVWTADLSYWINGREHDGTADPAWNSEEGFLQLHRELGVMPYYYYAKFGAAEALYDSSVTLRQESNGDLLLRILETPIGSLREETVFLPESCCHGITRHMVQTEADLDVMLYALEHRRLEPRNLDDYPERLKMWARHDGLPGLGLPRSPLPALAYEWAGLQSMVMLMVDCEEKVCQALAMMEEQEAPILEAVCELAPPLVHFCDNLSSDNLTSLYEPHMRRRHEHRLERLHAAGVKVAVHLDGAVRGLLPKLIAAGFDAIEALTPRPAGDMTVDEMAAVAGDSPVILWGGVPGAMFASPYTWPDMSSHIEHVLDVWGHRPFVLGVADQVPPDGDATFCPQIHALTH